MEITNQEKSQNSKITNCKYVCVLSFFVDKRYDIEVYTGFFVERDDKSESIKPSIHSFIHS